MEIIKVKVECNNLQCKHRWSICVNDYQITGNRVSRPLQMCPKCNRLDSPYIVDSQSPLIGAILRTDAC